jgi:hypothetical protein
MYLKEIAELKGKMERECNVRINNIIDQMIANEDYMKASWEDACASLRGKALELKIILTVEDNIGNNFSIGNYSSKIDMK